MLGRGAVCKAGARDMLLMLLNISVVDGGGGSRDSAAVLVDVVA